MADLALERVVAALISAGFDKQLASAWLRSFEEPSRKRAKFKQTTP